MVLETIWSKNIKSTSHQKVFISTSKTKATMLRAELAITCTTGWHLPLDQVHCTASVTNWSLFVDKAGHVSNGKIAPAEHLLLAAKWIIFILNIIPIFILSFTFVLPQQITSNKQFPLWKFYFHKYWICIKSIAWARSIWPKQYVLLDTELFMSHLSNANLATNIASNFAACNILMTMFEVTYFC